MTSTNCVLGILNALVKDKKVKKLLLTIHITILKEIWIARNLLKHQKKSLTNDVIIKKIITKLRETNKDKLSKALKTRNFSKHLIDGRRSGEAVGVCSTLSVNASKWHSSKTWRKILKFLLVAPNFEGYRKHRPPSGVPSFPRPTGIRWCPLL